MKKNGEKKGAREKSSSTGSFLIFTQPTNHSTTLTTHCTIRERHVWSSSPWPVSHPWRRHMSWWFPGRCQWLCPWRLPTCSTNTCIIITEHSSKTWGYFYTFYQKILLFGTLITMWETILSPKCGLELTFINADVNQLLFDSSTGDYFPSAFLQVLGLCA